MQDSAVDQFDLICFQFIFPIGCTSKPQERMQVSWRHRKLQLENLLEAAGTFWRDWFSTKAEIPHSHSSIIPEQQTPETRQQQPIQTGD